MVPATPEESTIFFANRHHEKLNRGPGAAGPVSTNFGHQDPDDGYHRGYSARHRDGSRNARRCPRIGGRRASYTGEFVNVR
jgi:hypothetical protein